MQLSLSQRRRRSGFTMLELMVVILIILMLAGLLLSSISKVLVFVDEVRAVNEVHQFSEALESFKLTYGRYPPSFIRLYEAPGAYTAANDYQSLNTLAAIFPGFDENVAHDWNNDGVINNANQPIVLYGNECLVYFVLGPPAGVDRIPAGFATNKANPVGFSATAPQRNGPFLGEVNMARIANRYNPAKGLYSGYNDPWGTPYAYFLGNDLTFNNYRGYLSYYQQPNDCDPALCGATFMPYFMTPSNPTLPTMGTPQPNQIKFHRGEKFQLISAGRDQLFGQGGHYNLADTQISTWNATNMQNPIQPDVNQNRQQDDYDNITNFTEGKMVK